MGGLRWPTLLRHGSLLRLRLHGFEYREWRKTDIERPSPQFSWRLSLKLDYGGLGPIC